jgi:hypothetical protein
MKDDETNRFPKIWWKVYAHGNSVSEEMQWIQCLEKTTITLLFAKATADLNRSLESRDDLRLSLSWTVKIVQKPDHTPIVHFYSQWLRSIVFCELLPAPETFIWELRTIAYALRGGSICRISPNGTNKFRRFQTAFEAKDGKRFDMRKGNLDTDPRISQGLLNSAQLSKRCLI